MGEDALTYTVNADGTFTVKLDGKDTRLVKESDLLAVKGASETSKREYEESVAKGLANLTEANRVKDETHQKLLQEQAAKTQLEEQAKESANLKTQVGELETKFNAAEEGRGKLEEELTGMKRSTLTKDFKVDEAKVKEMNLEQLRQAESSLQLVAAPGGPAKYDGGPGGPGPGASELPRIEREKAELQLARKIQTDRRAGKDISDPDYKP